MKINKILVKDYNIEIYDEKSVFDCYIPTRGRAALGPR